MGWHASILSGVAFVVVTIGIPSSSSTISCCLLAWPGSLTHAFEVITALNVWRPYSWLQEEEKLLKPGTMKHLAFTILRSAEDQVGRGWLMEWHRHACVCELSLHTQRHRCRGR